MVQSPLADHASPAAQHALAFELGLYGAVGVLRSIAGILSSSSMIVKFL